MADSQGIKRYLSLFLDRESARKTSEQLQQALAKAGDDGGKAFLRELRSQFDREMAGLKVKLAQGIISPAEFRKQSEAAARAFNKDLAGAIEKVRKEGTLTDREFEKLGRRFKRTADDGTSAFARLGSTLKGVGRGLLIGVTAPLTGLGALAVKNAADLDALRRALDSVTGSGAETADQLKRLKEVAKSPGIGFKEAIQGSVQLQAVGYNAQFAERALKEFANAIALTGGTKENLQGVLVQLTQMAGVGRVLTRDLRPILTQAPAVAQAVLKTFGTISGEEINKQVSTTQEFLERLLDTMAEMPRVSAGIRNSFDNLKDTLFRTSSAIGAQLVPAVATAVDKLSDFLNAVGEANPAAIRWAIALGAVVAVLGPLTLGLGVLVSLIPSLLAGFTALAAGIATLTGIALPALGLAGIVGVAVAGIGALSTAFVKSRLDALSASDAIDTFRASLAGLNEAQLKAKKEGVLAQRDALQAQLDRFEKAAAASSGRQRKHFEREADAVRKKLGELLQDYQALGQQIDALASAPPPKIPGLDADASAAAAKALQDEISRLSDGYGLRLLNAKEIERAFDIERMLTQQSDDTNRSLEDRIRITKQLSAIREVTQGVTVGRTVANAPAPQIGMQQSIGPLTGDLSGRDAQFGFIGADSVFAMEQKRMKELQNAAREASANIESSMTNAAYGIAGAWQDAFGLLLRGLRQYRRGGRGTRSRYRGRFARRPRAVRIEQGRGEHRARFRGAREGRCRSGVRVLRPACPGPLRGGRGPWLRGSQVGGPGGRRRRGAVRHLRWWTRRPLRRHPLRRDRHWRPPDRPEPQGAADHHLPEHRRRGPEEHAPPAARRPDGGRDGAA